MSFASQPAMLNTPSLVEAVVFLLAAPVGQVLHEATHFLVAWLLRARPQWRISVRESMFVAYDPPAPWIDRVVKLAPTTAGLTAAIVVIIFWGWPAGSWWLLAGGLAWYAYTLTLTPFTGNAADWRALGIDLSGVDGWRYELLKAAYVFVLVIAIQSSPYAANPYVYHFVVKTLLVVAVGLLVFALYDSLKQEAVIWQAR